MNLQKSAKIQTQKRINLKISGPLRFVINNVGKGMSNECYCNY